MVPLCGFKANFLMACTFCALHWLAAWKWGSFGLKLNQKFSSELAPGVFLQWKMGWQQKVLWGAVSHAHGNRFGSVWLEALKKYAQ